MTRSFDDSWLTVSVHWLTVMTLEERVGMKRLVAVVAAAVVGVVGGVLVAPLGAVAAQDSVNPPVVGAMPSEVPSAVTPAVTGDNVQSIAAVGSRMVIGGPFTAVAGVARDSLAAFDAVSGALSSGFAPTVDGTVLSVLPGPVADTVYVGGKFTAINGTLVKNLALLSTVNGSLVPGFKVPKINGQVNDLELYKGRLFVAGVFTKVGSVARGGLATFNAVTGAADPFMGVTLTERHNNSGTGATAPVGATAIDVSADGSRLVVIGNFRKADGLDRVQVALVNLTGATAAVQADWRTSRYYPLCFSNAFDSYMRGVSFSPDGSYFVVTATGGPNPGTLCDAASRFETGGSGQEVQPTWVVEAGGDTLWAVTITSSAVFVGGHQRWMNNPLGRDNARSGAVARPGLVALDPVSGRPLSWNPGRNPRGVAVFSMLATEQGLWITYNTDWIGKRQYKRQKLAFFPYQGGTTLAPTTTASLPTQVFVARSVPGQPTGLTVSNFNGTTASTPLPVASGIDWTTVRGAFAVGDQIYYGKSDATFWRAPLSGSSIGTSTKVDPYHDPKWMNVSTGSGTTTFDGATPTFYSQLGNVGGMFYDKGRLYYNQVGSPTLSWLWFSPDSGIVDGVSFTAASSVSFANTSGMFAAGGKLYFVDRTTGALNRADFTNGAVTGTPTLVSDPSTGGPDWRGPALFAHS